MKIHNFNTKRLVINLKNMQPSFLEKFDVWVGLSYFLTISRILFAGLCIYLILILNLTFTPLLLLLVIIFDIADGRVILLSKNVSNQSLLIRRITDSVSDRLIIQGILFSVYFVDLLSLWIYLIFLFREVALMFISGAIFLKRGKQASVNMYSRIATLIMGLTIINILMNNPINNTWLVLPFCLFALLGLGVFLLKR